MATLKEHSSLKPFDAALLQATKDDWRRTIHNSGILNLDYERLLESIDNHIDYTGGGNGDHLAYGVFKKGEDHACAIVHVVYTKKPAPTRGWLKMLELRLAPQYDQTLIVRDADTMIDVLKIYAAAIGGTFRLQAVHASNVVKIYGRNSDLLQLLVSLLPFLQAKGFNAKMEGRWLVIPKQTKK
ncbi:hypothetical protein JAO10_32960 [Burkholderia contaminans]|uniref:hypothetical protein n=1 Tax=Burkholderia contaminans TaxID=488447 RepID=UPI0018DDB24A|nr:hypothetical protein [Burkholderia contaminans]MBH9725143.1 hypothetical protein [Burkholderia contaminans]